MVSTARGYFGMAYLPAGSSTWQMRLALGRDDQLPGWRHLDGTYLTVEDQSGPSGYPVVYQCNNSGASLDCSVGSTGLQGAADVTQGYIKRGVKGITGADASPARSTRGLIRPAARRVRTRRSTFPKRTRRSTARPFSSDRRNLRPPYGDHKRARFGGPAFSFA